MKLPRLNSMIFKATALSALSATMLVACNQGGSSSQPARNQNPNVIVTSTGEVIPAAAAGAGQYDGAELDPYTALNQYGTWQTIGQERYFVPTGVDAQWQPYQNGSWSYDDEDQRGWSFVSQDKWGWLTEHYGIWRHHNRHGWVWMPFPDRHYEASVVTWFDQGEYVGWYPYSERYSRFYVNSFGFNDGFWAGGYRPLISLGFSNQNIFLGIVLVNRIDVTRPNIMSFVRHDRSLIFQVANAAHSEERIRQGLIGPIPGGNFARSHEFLQRSAAYKAPVGHSQVITSNGGAKIVQPFMPVGNRPVVANNNSKDRQTDINNRPPSPRADNHIRPSTPAPTTPAPSSPAKPTGSLNGMQPRPQTQTQAQPAQTSPQGSQTPQQNSPDRQHPDMHNPSIKTESHSDDHGNSVTITRRADDNSPPPTIRFNRVQQPTDSSKDVSNQQPQGDSSNLSRRGRQ
jgi:hypothetical protein